jgi:hypothetical protein
VTTWPWSGAWGVPHSNPGQNIRYPNHRRRSLWGRGGSSPPPQKKIIQLKPSDRITVNYAQKYNANDNVEYKIICSKEPGSRPATGWTVQGSNLDKGKSFSVLQNHPHWLWAPSNLLFNGYRGSLPAVKRPGREFDH